MKSIKEGNGKMQVKFKLIAFVCFSIMMSILYTGCMKQQANSLISQPAPGFTLQDLDGNSVSLSDFKGKPVILNFWATW